jgi:hypothetical protein
MSGIRNPRECVYRLKSLYEHPESRGLDHLGVFRFEEHYRQSESD